MESVDDFEEFITAYHQKHPSMKCNIGNSQTKQTNSNAPKQKNKDSNVPTTSIANLRTTTVTDFTSSNLSTTTSSNSTQSSPAVRENTDTTMSTPLAKRSLVQLESTRELQKKAKLETGTSRPSSIAATSSDSGRKSVDNGANPSALARKSVIVPLSKPGTACFPKPIPVSTPNSQLSLLLATSSNPPTVFPANIPTIPTTSTSTVLPTNTSNVPLPNPPLVLSRRPIRAVMICRVPGLPPNLTPVPFTSAFLQSLSSVSSSAILRPVHNSPPTTGPSTASLPNVSTLPATRPSQSTPPIRLPPPNPTTPVFQYVTQRAYEVLKLISPTHFPDTFLEAGFFKADIVEPYRPEYYKILAYVVNSHAHTSFGIDLISVLKVTRPLATATTPVPTLNPEGTPRFRMMLWHGTKPTRIASILKDGFKCPQVGSQMFGKGVYFADRISKSAQYCNQNINCATPRPGEIGYLFLCDVTLGKCYNAKNVKQSYREAPTATRYDGSVMTFDSIKCTGENIPDRQQQREIDGVIWPVGRTIKNTRFPTYTVLYNEFIVYNPAMVKVKYLVKVQFK